MVKYLSTAIDSRLQIEARRELQIIESKILSMFSKRCCAFLSVWLDRVITTVSNPLDTLTSMSATAKLQIKKYIGECRFLFRDIAATTKRFSRRLTMPRITNTSGFTNSCS